jgi:hypothetical protein
MIVRDWIATAEAYIQFVDHLSLAREHSDSRRKPRVQRLVIVAADTFNLLKRFVALVCLWDNARDGRQHGGSDVIHS